MSLLYEKSGRDGKDGKDGKSYGESGTNGKAGTSGNNINCQIRITKDGPKLFDQDTRKTFPLKNNTIKFESVGGHGGRGGDGHSGSPGIRGRNGSDGFHGDGSPGGDGGPGGPGGHGGDGNYAGSGGHITINLSPKDGYNLYNTAFVIDEYPNNRRGTGGRAGKGGKGGPGGEGGRGGRGDSWTTEDWDGTRHHHSGSDGRNGRRGPDGSNGTTGSRGRDGKDGETRFIMDGFEYNELPKPVLKQVEIITGDPNHDSIVEPGNFIHQIRSNLINVRMMPIYPTTVQSSIRSDNQLIVPIDIKMDLPRLNKNKACKLPQISVQSTPIQEREVHDNKRFQRDTTLTVQLYDQGVNRPMFRGELFNGNNKLHIKEQFPIYLTGIKANLKSIRPGPNSMIIISDILSNVSKHIHNDKIDLHMYTTDNYPGDGYKKYARFFWNYDEVISDGSLRIEGIEIDKLAKRRYNVGFTFLTEDISSGTVINIVLELKFRSQLIHRNVIPITITEGYHNYQDKHQLRTRLIVTDTTTTTTELRDLRYGLDNSAVFSLGLYHNLSLSQMLNHGSTILDDWTNEIMYLDTRNINKKINKREFAKALVENKIKIVELYPDNDLKIEYMYYFPKANIEHEIEQINEKEWKSSFKHRCPGFTEITINSTIFKNKKKVLGNRANKISDMLIQYYPEKRFWILKKLDVIDKSNDDTENRRTGFIYVVPTLDLSEPHIVKTQEINPNTIQSIDLFIESIHHNLNRFDANQQVADQSVDKIRLVFDAILAKVLAEIEIFTRGDILSLEVNRDDLVERMHNINSIFTRFTKIEGGQPLKGKSGKNNPNVINLVACIKVLVNFVCSGISSKILLTSRKRIVRSYILSLVNPYGITGSLDICEGFLNMTINDYIKRLKKMIKRSDLFILPKISSLSKFKKECKSLCPDQKVVIKEDQDVIVSKKAFNSLVLDF